MAGLKTQTEYLIYNRDERGYWNWQRGNWVDRARASRYTATGKSMWIHGLPGIGSTWVRVQRKKHAM